MTEENTLGVLPTSGCRDSAALPAWLQGLDAAGPARPLPGSVDKASGPSQAIPAPPALVSRFPGRTLGRGGRGPAPRPSPGAARRCPGGGGSGEGEVSAGLRTTRVSTGRGGSLPFLRGPQSHRVPPQAVALRDPRACPGPSRDGGTHPRGRCRGRPRGDNGSHVATGEGSGTTARGVLRGPAMATRAVVGCGVRQRSGQPPILLSLGTGRNTKEQGQHLGKATVG